MPRFVLARVDTRNGRAPEARELLVSRNTGYVLFLDREGREHERLMQGRGSRPIDAGRVLAAMRRVLEKPAEPLAGLDLLKRLAGSEDEEVRKEALVLMGREKARRPEAVPPLVAALLGAREKPSTALAAARSLAQLGTAAVPAVPALVSVAEDRGLPSNLRQAAVMALGPVDPRGRQARAALLRALKDEDAAVVSGAAMALRDLGPGAAEAVPHLVEALGRTKGEERAVRYYLSEALGMMGRFGEPALSMLDRLAEGTADPRPVGREGPWNVEGYAHRAAWRIRRALQGGH